MSKVFDQPITIQKLDKSTEEWSDRFDLHARINKTKSDNEYLSAGSVQGKKYLTFELRYFSVLEDISYNTQLYRVMYRGRPFNIVDYDDFMQRHITVKLSGVLY